MSQAPRYDITVDVDRVDVAVKQIVQRMKPEWGSDVLHIQRFGTPDTTNGLFGCFQPGCRDSMVVVRVFGHRSVLTIDREAEIETHSLLSQALFSPPLYCSFNNGMAYGFAKGDTLTAEMALDNRVRSSLAKKVARLHSLTGSIQRARGIPLLTPDIVPKILLCLDNIPEQYTNEATHARLFREFGGKQRLQEEFDKLRTHLDSLTCDVVFSHNDLLLQNIVFDKETDNIELIDFEYTDFNAQAFDIGCHFAECTATGSLATMDYADSRTREFQLSWIRAAHFLFGAWALTQVDLSQKKNVDYIGFAFDRFMDYFNQRAAIFKEYEDSNLNSIQGDK